MTGERLLHYEMLDKLGEGGMGVVYKARDTHLDRIVAVKVLPPDKVADAERKRRFVLEAKAASALNHAGIIHVYDVSADHGHDFIVMEHVEGKTLGALIPRCGMRLSEALNIAIQVAGALAAAHAKGIVHRDLKPANVMVTPDGTVKILDFGLAKLTEPAGPSPDAETRTMKAATEEGTILGTATYMSPEQAEGKPVDGRSDIFSFGALLYEMVTGRRAFQGDSTVSTLAAILHNEPAPLAAEAPHDLRKLVNRCLRKDPAHRFQHMDDLKVALQELKDDTDSGKLEGALPTPRVSPRRRRLWAAIVALLLSVATGAFFFVRHGLEADTPLKVVPLTSYSGAQSAPTFSPDGSQVAFSWNGEGQDNFDIYVKLVSGGPPLRLTADPARDVSPVWSPDGSQIAFVRGGFVYLISPLGGPERKVTKALEPIPSARVLAWSPDGKSLAVVDRDSETSPRSIYLTSVATGERRRLTTPQTGAFGGDFECAFSPDAKSLAFSRMTSFLWHDIYILPLANNAPSGEPWRLTDDKSRLAGLAWTPDSREVVYSSRRGGRRSLWRISAYSGAQPRRVPGTEDAFDLAISRGPFPRLAYQRTVHEVNIWRMEISSAEKTMNPPSRLIASTGLQRDPQFSPDGKRIAFTSERSGGSEIWVSDSEGSNLVQLTAFAGSRTAGAPRWSPDGRQIAFDSGTGPNFSIYVISAEGGAPRNLTGDTSSGIRPSWSQDGRWIYFGSDWPGTGQIWKVPVEGGKAVQVTRGGGLEAFESPDGRTLYFARGWNTPGIMSMPAEGGAESLVIGSARMGHWAVAEKGIWYLDFEARSGNGSVPLMFYDFDTRTVSKRAAIEKIGFTADASFSVTRDGRRAIWRQTDRNESDLMLVENFR